MVSMVSGRRALAIVAALLAAGAAASCASAPAGPRTLSRLTAAERVELVRRARVWEPVETGSLDLLRGPAEPNGFPFEATVTCDYTTPDEPQGGATPKFRCIVPPDDVVKVKYGRDNGEVYAEVAATRLLWALGFAADRMYPVRVRCRKCPLDPWSGGPEVVPEKTFDPACIERKLPGRKIATRDFEGWSWYEADRIDSRAGGAPRAHVDALKLLAAFLQHGDNKPGQQRLLCPASAVTVDPVGNEGCTAPVLYIQDPGLTFGAANFFNSNSVDLDAWAGVPVWKDPAGCVAHLANSYTGNLKHPRISEDGRRFLAGRLALLSEAQVRDLFRAARFERRGRTTRRGGAPRAATLDDWVAVFMEKRAQVIEHRCPR